MARLVLKGVEERKLVPNGVSLYVLIESPIARVIGADEDTTFNVELYWSDKHNGYYIAAYPTNTKPPCDDKKKD